MHCIVTQSSIAASAKKLRHYASDNKAIRFLHIIFFIDDTHANRKSDTSERQYELELRTHLSQTRDRSR